MQGAGGQSCDTEQCAIVIFLDSMHSDHIWLPCVLQLEGEKQDLKKSHNTYHVIIFQTTSELYPKLHTDIQLCIVT